MDRIGNIIGKIKLIIPAWTLAWMLALTFISPGIISIPGHAQPPSSSDPLEVQVMISPPYPTHLSDFKAVESTVFITVRNTSSSSQDFIFSGSLRNEDVGISISTDPALPATECFSIGPGETRNFTGADLEETLDPDRLIYRGTTRERIRGDEALPEGHYVLCLRAMDCLDPTAPLSPIPDEFNMGCASYDMSYVDPPVVINPECETTPTIPTTQSTIPVMWTWMPPARGYDEINFHIKLVEVDPPSRNPFDALNTSPPFFETDVINATSYNLLIPDDVILEEGQKYAFQVTASDPAGEIVFKNEGRSVPCVFWYGTPGDVTTRVIPLYPREGDILPFETIPLIGAVDQLGENTINQSTITFDPEVTSSESRVSERAEHKSRETTPWDYSQLVLEAFPAEFNANCSWQIETSIYTGERDVDLSTGYINFATGMPVPALNSPGDDDEIASGSLNLSWSSTKPDMLLPPVDLSSLDETLGSLTVDERWVLEIARSSAFDSVVHSISERIEVTVDAPSDSTALIDALYGEKTRSVSLAEAGDYFWRVKWVTDPADAGSEAYAVSPVYEFSVIGGAGLPEDVPATTSVDGPCVGDCEMGAITDRTAVSTLSEGDIVTIRNFDLEITVLTSSTSPFNGEGVITIPFMNSLRVNVTFESLQVNASGLVFSGSATAVDDIPGTTMEDFSTTIAGETVEVPQPGFTDTEEFEALFEGGERLISGLTGDRPIGMPVGLDNEVGGIPYTIGITGMTFDARRATFDALMAMDIPALGNKMIALGASDVCLTPSGLGETGRLYLARDWELVQAGGTEFAFTGAESAASLEEITYAEWDCSGFKCLRINGRVEFPRDKLVRENEAGDVLSEKVTGNINVESCRGTNIMARIEIDPFQINGFKGWGFHISEAWLDLSDAENPSGLSFPEGYVNTSIMREADDGSMEPMPDMINTWKGFFLRLAHIRTPSAFSSGGSRGSANIEHLIIDETGFTANINVDNLIDYSSGNVSGWAFSLDTIEVQFVQNSFRSGGFNGKLGTPLFEGDDHLKYSSTLSLTESDNIHYDFNVLVGEDAVDVNAWKIRMSFKPGSRITFEYNEGEEDPVSLEAKLNGSLGIKGDMIEDIPGMDFTGIEFENLVVRTEPEYFNVGETGLDGGVFGLASPQKYLDRKSDGDGSGAGGFPVSIDNIALAGSPMEPGIEFTTRVNFVGEDDGGFSGTFVFTLAARLTIPEVTGDKFSLSDPSFTPESIYVGSTFGGLELEGYVDFYKETVDGEEASGARGQVSIVLPVGGSVDIYANFGSTPTFRYWRVDGLVILPEGIPVFSGIELLGLGGGVYYHMTLPEDDASMPSLASVDLSAESTEEVSIAYRPTTDVLLGFTFTVILALEGNSDTFNMDVTLRAEGSEENALQMLAVSGNAYFMKGLDEPTDAAYVWANVNVVFDNEPGNKKMYGSVRIFVNAEIAGGAVYIKGGGDDFLFTEAKFHFSKTKWLVHMPPPVDNRIQRNELIAGVDFGIIDSDILTLSSYILVGHDVPNQLPPLPEKVQSFFASDKTEAKPGNTVDNTVSDRDPMSESQRSGDIYTSGNGFATGVHMELHADLKFAIFFAELYFAMGLDVNFTQHPLPCLETRELPGLNGYYAKGRVYAALEGKVGIDLDLFFVKKRITILGLGAAFELRGEFPNPYYFQGRVALRYNILSLIKGTANINAEFGTECTTVAYESPFGDLKLISDIGPSGNADVFTTANTYFNLPVYRTIEFPGEKKDEVYVYKPYIDEYVFRDPETKEEITGIGAVTRLRDDNLRAELIPEGSYLPGDRNIEVYINVRAWEIIREDGRNRRIEAQVPDPDGGGMMDWPGEPKTTQFSTGPEPTKIPDDQVAYTYPIKRQNYFMQDETDGGKGILRFRTVGMADLFRGRIDLDGDGSYDPLGERFYEYVVRFTHLETEEITETRLNYSGGLSMWYELPRLENDAYYSMQIVGKSMRQAAELIKRARERAAREDMTLSEVLGPEIEGAADVFEDREFLDQIQRDFAQLQVEEGIEGGEGSVATYASEMEVNFKDYAASIGLSEPTLPGDTVGEHEHMLYSYNFKTSEYNTLNAKLSDMSYEVEVNDGGFFSLTTSFDINVELGEPFDVFDIYGYEKHGEQQLPPLLTLRSADNAYVHKVQREVYSVYNGLLGVKRIDRSPNYTTWCVKCMPIDSIDHEMGKPPVYGIIVDNDSDILDPIPDWALENAAGFNEPATTASSGGSDDGYNGSPSLPGTGMFTSSSGGGYNLGSSLSSGMLNGTINNVSTFSPGFVDLSTDHDPVYDLILLYDLNNFVLNDAARIRNNIAKLFNPFAYAPSWYGFFRNVLLYHHCQRAGLEAEALEFFDEHEGFNFNGYEALISNVNHAVWEKADNLLNSSLYSITRMPKGEYDVQFNYNYPVQGEFGRTDIYSSSPRIIRFDYE